jgi:hypothetical protein
VEAETLDVDVSCGCFHDTYATFDALRLMWSQMAGYGITDYQAHGGPIVPNINFDLYTDQDSLGYWPRGAPDDPLIILLVHYETRGIIRWSHCALLADRLEQLESSLMKGERMNWVLLTQQFIRGLRYAASQKLDVVFS